MGVRSGRSRVTDLLVLVFGRNVHPDWHGCLQHGRYRRGSWEADVRIIHGGHAIAWAAGDARITELLIRADSPVPDTGLLFKTPVVQERTTRLRPHVGIEYQACVETERLDAELFRHLTEELILDGPRDGLFHRDQPAGRFDPAPISRIHVEARARGLSIHGFHTFPDESAIVRTQSLFEIVAIGPRRTPKSPPGD